MNSELAISGNSGPNVRSDCKVELQLRPDGGIRVDLSSKVECLYGQSIRDLVFSVLGFFGVGNARVKITDTGALPFVISARLESAVKQLMHTDLEFLPEMLPENGYQTVRDRFRFTRLYLPGNSPGLMINAGLHSAEGIILDLEDSVAPEKKDESRLLVRNALRQVNFYGAERMVRINQGQRGIEDLDFVIPHNVNLVIIPKCETPDHVRNVFSRVEELRSAYSIKNSTFLMPVIESALGVENSSAIARSCPEVVALAIGLEDYTADLGVSRTPEGLESLYARSRLVVAAKAAGIQPVDSVFSDTADLEGLKRNVRVSKSLGFEGMGCIHPRQIPVIREGFSPGEEEIERSKKIVMAYETARENGMGVVALGSKMIDPPVVARAQRTIDLAIRLGLLAQVWRDRQAPGENDES